MESEKGYLRAALASDRDHLLNTLSSMLEFNIVSEHALLHVQQCQNLIEEINKGYSLLYLQLTESKPDTCRPTLTRDLQAAQVLLHSIRCAIRNLEPSKPWLSDLDIRNQKYKDLIQSYKALVDSYLTIVLENQRRFSLFFEKQFNEISPSAGAQQALQSNLSPPLAVQILLQRGERTGDSEAQLKVSSVECVHKDLQVLSAAIRTLSEIRNELNVALERYRRRWPLVMQEDGLLYVIGDDLNLIESVSIAALHETKNHRRRLFLAGLALIALVFLCLCIYLL
ncbi:hypothetical protein BY458DRAFT_161692 [Sporodiniella umbellata]|nr:hypothetical protein BY458DRAFT_161692 [Sporodiniella umbellata]